MANQRKKGKKLVGAFVDEKEHEALKRQAKARGMSMSDLLKELIAKSQEPKKQK